MNEALRSDYEAKLAELKQELSDLESGRFTTWKMDVADKSRVETTPFWIKHTKHWIGFYERRLAEKPEASEHNG